MTNTDTKPEKGKRDTEATEATEREHPFYCPGCGRVWNFLTECRGMTPAAPHPPIEVVSTDELKRTGDHEHGDPVKHTPAPDTTNLGVGN